MGEPKNIQQVLSELKRKFLTPSEKNRSELTELLEQAFQYLPQNLDEHDPYLGKDPSYYSFLSEFEEIPFQPKPRNKILSAAVHSLWGQIRWHSPSTLHNITPPPMLDSVAISAITNLYNPNMIWDFVSAGSHKIEQQVIRQISSLVGWKNKTGGSFTFGGKGCLIYAIRLGLNRCLSDVSIKGINSKYQPIVITSKFNHYIIENVCSLLGLGSNGCIRVKTKEDETLDLCSFREVLEKSISSQVPIACIILSGGNTLHIAIDPLQEAVKIIDELCTKYQLNYRPYIYFDMVVGWPWLFFKKYNYKINPLEIKHSILMKIKKASINVSDALLADGVGIDFHKIGFCPYSTSLFMTKDRNELQKIHSEDNSYEESRQYGHNFLQHYTLEHSRSSAPVLAAWIALQNAGILGFQAYIAHLISIAEAFREILKNYQFEYLNPFSLGFASVYYPIFKRFSFNYDCLLKSSPKVINQYNQIAFKLFEYLESGESKNSKKLVLRFLPKYHQAKCGEWPAAIAIYPMSLDITIENAREFAVLIGERMIQFGDFYQKEFMEKSTIPSAIHK